MREHPRTEEMIKLRQEGSSYSEICERLGVGKSTLSGILKRHDVSLTEEQKVRLKEKEKENQRQYIGRRESWLEKMKPVWEDRRLRRVAQRAEHIVRDDKAAGANPAIPTI